MFAQNFERFYCCQLYCGYKQVLKSSGIAYITTYLPPLKLELHSQKIWLT